MTERDTVMDSTLYIQSTYRQSNNASLESITLSELIDSFETLLFVFSVSYIARAYAWYVYYADRVRHKVQSPVHTSNNVEATFDFVAKNGYNVERVLR